MNNTVEFKIEAKLIDCYLYAGYLFFVMANGRITYVSYHSVIHMLKKKYPKYSSLIDLIFLHNEYSKTTAGKILFAVQEIKDTMRKLWLRAAKDIDFVIKFEDVEPNCHEIGEWTSMPLDIRMYAMRLFLGCKDGLFESQLNMENTSYRINPSKLDKIFDAKVINLNAKSGSIIISADNDGLFSGEMYYSKERLDVSDRPITEKRSIRTSWASVCDIVNYESSNRFEYIRNTSANIEKRPEKRFRYGDTGEQKRIVKFGDSIFNMDTLLKSVNFKKEEIQYCFNSSRTGFFILKDGRFINVNFRNEDGFAEVYFSSTIQEKTKNKRKNRKVLSGCLVPNGCVVEYYDSVILYQKGKAYTLIDKPVNNVRTYIGSRNYRDIVSIISEDEVSFHSVDSFDLIDSKPAFGKKDNNTTNIVPPLPQMNDNDDLPF